MSALSSAIHNTGHYDPAAPAILDRCRYSNSKVAHDLYRKPLPFDLKPAYALYKALFGEIEDVI